MQRYELIRRAATRQSGYAYIEPTYTKGIAPRITWHITPEMYTINMVTNKETVCFLHGNTVFPAKKHSVSIFVTGVEHIVNQIDSEQYVSKCALRMLDYVCFM